MAGDHRAGLRPQAASGSPGPRHIRSQTLRRRDFITFDKAIGVSGFIRPVKWIQQYPGIGGQAAVTGSKMGTPLEHRELGEPNSKWGQGAPTTSNVTLRSAPDAAGQLSVMPWRSESAKGTISTREPPEQDQRQVGPGSASQAERVIAHPRRDDLGHPEFSRRRDQDAGVWGGG